ncbi:MAG: DUF2085 domain-containing protein [Bellilinea sp.]
MTGQTAAIPITKSRLWARRVSRWGYKFSRYWILSLSVLIGLYVGLPFLAPVFMALGLEFPARIIYIIYSFLCHQLPQRSYFLFGQQFTYSLADIQAVWQNTTNFRILRQFIGTPEMGWKVAWSDRMVSMYTGILLFSWIWYPLRRRIRGLSWQGLLIFLLPMAVDGFTHMLSDLAGIGQGFRDTNAWLAALTNNSFPATFYAGDMWGSFNSIMRLVTGLLFGAGVVWFGFPYLNEYFEDFKLKIQEKFQRAGIPL